MRCRAPVIWRGGAGERSTRQRTVEMRSGPSRRGVRYRYRLVAAMLLVSLPLMVVLAVLLTSQASASLTEAGEHDGVGNAQSVALRLEDWLSERRENLQQIADASTDRLDNLDTAVDLVAIDKTYGDFRLLEVTDLTGKVLASSRPEDTVDLAGQDWFGTAAGGQPVTTPLVQRGDHIQWVIAQPIVGGNGQPQGVVIGELNPAVLTDLLYDTTMGAITDDTTLLAAGSLHTVVDNAATQQATINSDPGSARYTDLRGRDVVGGYDVVDG